MKDPRILIVEDDPISRFMLTEMVDQLGYPHEAAVGGKQCIDMMRRDQGRADIILMDVHMPEVSGLDACAQIRDAQHPVVAPPAIIAVTADEFWQDPGNCAAAGFDGVLSKPISLDALRRVLAQVIGATGAKVLPGT